MSRRWWRSLPALAARGSAFALFTLPLLAALPLALAEGLRGVGWAALADDPQTLPALASSVFTALASTTLALLLTMALVTALHGTPAWRRIGALLAPMLALPHAAFAIGLAWLIAPSGWIARLVAPLAGWTEPPAWQTVNDPAGLALVAVLLLKELPFLLWNALALLSRPEVAALLQREIAVARSLGYTPQAWWWRVGWALWLPRLAWPLLAVLAYSLTVVDLALIVGPVAPPTLAALAWQGLADASAERNAQGAASALLLTLLLAALIGGLGALWRLAAARWRRIAAAGRRPPPPLPGSRRGRDGGFGLAAVALIYAAAALAIVVLSLAGPWPFPARWPGEASSGAWLAVGGSAGVVGFSAGLAAAASLVALLVVVAWLEAVPPRWDAAAAPWILAPLVLPQLLWLVGLYRGALALRLDGTLAGLLWVHVIVVLPYVYTALAPAWRGFDRRYEWAALALGRGRWAFRWTVKWPLLAPPLASAAAIGFAVAIAQYLATQFIGAGRHATLTTEAVTLASGGQRNVAAAFALLQALLPMLAFALAALAGRGGGRPDAPRVR